MHDKIKFKEENVYARRCIFSKRYNQLNNCSIYWLIENVFWMVYL